MQGLFSGEIFRDLLTFLPKISLKLASSEKNLIAKGNLAKAYVKILVR